MIIKSIYLHIKWFLFNLFTIIMGIVIRRDTSIWLFGAWMSKRYADNPRALYQYLTNQKKLYGINKVIWVTSNPEILEELTSNGYESYLINSKESLYYHLKAGVHVVCNMYDNINGYPGDIYGRFSYGAYKIQLWHGIGIKAVGNLRKTITSKNPSTVRNFMKKIAASPMLFPGAWNTCYWLVAGPENRRVTIADHGVKDERRIIYATYPRFFVPLFFMKKERDVIYNLRDFSKNGYKIVFYLPTFRGNYDNFISPEKISGFYDFIRLNKIIWVTKKHLASSYNSNVAMAENILVLSAEFDINTILHLADVVISDYSSVITDAIYLKIKTINYVPDYNYYQNEDRGFVGDFSLYNPGLKVYDPCNLFTVIQAVLQENYFTDDIEENYRRSSIRLLGVKSYNYDIITRLIIKSIKGISYDIS